MTLEQFKRERNYRISMALARLLLREGMIDDADYRTIDVHMILRFRPILSGLYPENNLIQSPVRGNM